MARIKLKVGTLSWKLRNLDLEIKNILTCMIVRSVFVYTGTSLLEASLWKKEDGCGSSDSLTASLKLLAIMQ